MYLTCDDFYFGHLIRQTLELLRTLLSSNRNIMNANASGSVITTRREHEVILFDSLSPNFSDHLLKFVIMTVLILC